MAAAYNDATRAQALQLAREGVDYLEIELELDPSRSTVRSWARAAGVPPRSTRHVVPDFDEATKERARTMKTAGASVREIMAATGASHDAVWRWTRARREVA